MKKHPYRYGFIAVVTSVLFFIVAFVGLVHMFWVKYPAIQLPTHKNAAYLAGYRVGKYFKFYAIPFFNVVVGWLLFKFGREKMLLSQTQKSNS